MKTAETLAGALRAELAEVQHARQELRLARHEVDLLRVGAAGAGVPGLEEVLELSRGVAGVRRQYQACEGSTRRAKAVPGDEARGGPAAAARAGGGAVAHQGRGRRAKAVPGDKARDSQ